MNFFNHHRSTRGGRESSACYDAAILPPLRAAPDSPADPSSGDLRGTEALLKGILESTADGILAVDGQGETIYANQRFAKLWEIPDGLLKGNVEHLLLNFVVPQLTDPEALLNEMNALADTAEPEVGVLLLKDGRAVERHSQAIQMDGAVVGRMWSFRDVTQLSQDETALQESRDQFRNLVEQATTGIIIIQDRRFAYVNPRFCEIHGYATQQELIGTSPLYLMAKNVRRDCLEKLRPLLKGEVDAMSQELVALRKDGTIVEIGAGCSRSTFRGRPAIISMTQDITEKKRMEEERQRYFEQLNHALMSTVEVATIINEMRDPYTAGHERRVGDIAAAIGSELGYDAHAQEGLHIAGHLHDIGKINVPVDILVKPGKLSKLEYQLIQEHAQASHDVLKGVEFPWPVAQVALQHHERCDGSGYPQGLRGKAILHEARIMAVADVLEAMSSHRPYRAALGIESALNEIERGSGTLYDGEVANACLSLFREHGYQLPL